MGAVPPSEGAGNRGAASLGGDGEWGGGLEARRETELAFCARPHPESLPWVHLSSQLPCDVRGIVSIMTMKTCGRGDHAAGLGSRVELCAHQGCTLCAAPPRPCRDWWG